jgi:zinc protease
LTYTDPRVAQPYVIRSYLAPERDPGDQDTAAALTMLAALLGGDAATSFLGERLQFDSQRSVYTSAFYDGFSIDDGSFGLINVPVPGVSLDEAEADLDAAVAAFIETGVDMEKFERLKTQIRASEIYAKDSTQGLARRYGQALAMGFSVEDVQAWTETLMAVTPEDVMAAADMIFDRNKAVTGFLTRPEPSASETPAEVTQ